MSITFYKTEFIGWKCSLWKTVNITLSLNFVWDSYYLLRFKYSFFKIFGIFLIGKLLTSGFPLLPWWQPIIRFHSVVVSSSRYQLLNSLKFQHYQFGRWIMAEKSSVFRNKLLHMCYLLRNGSWMPQHFDGLVIGNEMNKLILIYFGHRRRGSINITNLPIISFWGSHELSKTLSEIPSMTSSYFQMIRCGIFAKVIFNEAMTSGGNV